jgi:hypothetical protein
MYFIAIELCSFHEFTTVCAACLIFLTVLLCFAYALPDQLRTRNGIINNEKKRKIMLALKITNVSLTVFAFLVIFASDMHLDIATDIQDYIGYKPSPGVYPSTGFGKGLDS